MDVQVKNKEQDVIIQDHDVKIKSIFDMIDNQNYKISQIFKRLDDSDLNIKNLKLNQEKTQQKITLVESQSKERVENIKNDLFDTLSKAQNKFDKNSKFLMNEFTKQKTENLNKIDESKEFTNQEISKNSERIENLLDQFYNNQIKTFEKYNSGMNTKISKLREELIIIKDESNTNDSLFDTQIQKVDKKIDKITSNFIKPTSDLENKFVLLSNNFNHLEKKSQSSNSTMRDVIRKLI